MKKEMIARIRSKWSKLKIANLQSMLETDIHDLVRMVQDAYGYSRLRAERECHDFQLSLRPALTRVVAVEHVSRANALRKFSNS